MRRNSNVGGFIATAVLFAAAGCATSRADRVDTPPLIPVPAPTVTVQTEQTTPMPPVSIGPRAPEPPARPEPPVMPTPPPAPKAPAAPPRPSIAPPTPPGTSGRFIVLNFDNADIETVIH